MDWTNAHATGIPAVDDQHKVLFKSVNDFRKALEANEREDSCGPMLTFLERFTRKHFVFEEGCMEQHRCPVAQQNKREHAAILATLHVHREWYTTGGYDPNDAHLLLDALEHWLESHICRVDRQLKHCVKSTDA